MYGSLTLFAIAVLLFQINEYNNFLNLYNLILRNKQQKLRS